MRKGWAMFLAICGLLLLPLPAAAGGGGGGGGPCAGFGAGAELIMRDNCFDGVAHFAEGGTTIVVQNKGELPHTFTAVDGSFDTGVLSPGESHDIQVGPDGVIRVYCTLHGTAHGTGMAGVLLVGDSASQNVATIARGSPGSGSFTSGNSGGEFASVEEALRELLGASRFTLIAIVATGAVLGGLVIGMSRRQVS